LYEEKHIFLRRKAMRSLAQVLITGTVYALLGWVGLHYAYLPTSISLLWLPTGWAIGMVWWWGRPALVGAALAVIVLSGLVEGWGWAGLARAGISWIAYGSITTLLRRLSFDSNFRYPRDLIVFSCVLGGVLAFTAVLQNSVTLLTGALSLSAFWENWWHWWGGNLLGGLLMATPLLAYQRFKTLKLKHWGEIALASGLVVMLTYFVRMIDPSHYAPLLLVAAFPVLMWATLRFEIAGLSLTLLALALGLGPPFGMIVPSGAEQMTAGVFFTYWLFLVMSYHTMMVLGIYVRQKREFAQKLEDAYLQMEAILENAPTVAIQGYDAEGRVVFWNRASEEMYGYTREQALGKTLSQLLFSPEQEQEYRVMIQEILRTGKPAPLREWEIRIADGQTRYILSSLFPVRLREGTVVICADIDITERKRLENQLLQAQKMESIGRLAGGVAHDFNNMLAAIMGYAELGMTRVPPDHPVQQDMQRILEAAERAANIVRQLLGFARKQFAQPRPTDINQVIQEMLPLFEHMLGKGVEVKLELHSAPQIVLIDPAQLEQILMNLVLNARDAMPNGGTITIRTYPHRVEKPIPALPKDAPPGEYECLSVRDEGIGIAPEDLPHIFEPFYTTKGVYGHGLGLATVYGIVDQNHGFLQVFSQPGQGTEFCICFPRYHEPVVAKPLLPGEGVQTPPARILLVEDDNSVRESLSLMLQMMGHSVHACATPEEALEVSQQNAFDILITDVGLPRMDGYQLAEQLARHCPQLRCVFMSGYQDPRLPIELPLRHVFLSKPFSLRRLQEALKELQE
jgi:PAS domain S-box-containing protein